MKMKKKGLLTKVVAGAMALALCASGLGTPMVSKAALLQETIEPYTYDATDPLFAATKFHIFAKNEASVVSHCNGNIAATVFTPGSNSGSRSLTESQGTEYTYLKKVNQGVLDFGKNTVLVFGEDTKVYYENNQYNVSINNGSGQVSKVEPAKAIYVEKPGTDFIDFDSEFAKLSNLSLNLAHETPTSTVTYSENTINLPATTETMYIDLEPSDFMDRAFNIRGEQFTTGQAIVINVNLGTLTEYKLPFHQVNIYPTGSSAPHASKEDWGDLAGHGNVLWNFYATDENGNKTTFKGTITTCREFKGSVLAPDATVSAEESNQDGNFIGQNVILKCGETHRWDFGGKLKAYGNVGSLQAKVTDVSDGSSVPAKGVELKVYDGTELVATIETDENGETSVIGNLEKGKEYKVEMTTPAGYTSTETLKTQVISTANPDVVEFTIEKDALAVVSTGYFKVTVKDVTTGKMVEGITVEIKNSADTAITVNNGGKTNSNGTTTSEELTISGVDAENNYTISISGVPENYDIVGVDTDEDGEVDKEATSTLDVLTDANPDQVTFFIKKKEAAKGAGSIQIKVWAIEDGKVRPIEGARVEIDDAADHIIKVVTVETDEDGSTEIVKNLFIGNKYSTTYVDAPEGFEIAESVTADELKAIKDAEGETGDIIVAGKSESEVTITDKNPDIVYYVLKQTKGSLGVNVVDTDGNPVKGVTVEINKKTDDGLEFVGEYTTDATGYIDEIYNLPTGDEYVATVTGVPSEYNMPTTKEKDGVIKENTVTQLEFLVSKAADPTGDLEVTVRDEDTQDPIPDATVEIKDKTTGEVVKTDKTDGNGQVLIEGLKPGDYVIHVPEVPGYDVPKDKETSVEAGKVTEEELVVKLTETEAPTTEAPTTEAPTTEAPTTEAPTTENPTTEPEKGKLNVTIYDKDTGAKIPGATIQIKDSDGNVVKEIVTDETGNFVVDLIPGDYTIDTVVVPDEYTAPDDVQTTVTAGGEKKEELVVSTKAPEKGCMEVVITDKNTKKPIPGATVVVKDKDGNVVATVQTDENGKTPIIKDLIVGQTYTVQTTVVPDGYTAPSPTSQEIKSPELVTVPLQVGRDSGVDSAVGSLYVIITDKNTGSVIPNATVQVSNSAGEVVKTVVTDETGAFTVTELKPDTYTIKTVSVPSGYTAPDPESATVKANARTDVHLYVAKSVSKTPNTTTPTTDTAVKTGDDSNVFMFGLMGLMACLGIVMVGYKKRKDII